MPPRPTAGAAPAPRPWAPLRRRLFWTLMLGLAAATGWINGDGRLQRAYIDQISARVGRPAPQEVVIVAIDDASLEALGRWPWPRSVHAALLDRLSRAGSRVVGLDLIFSEPQPFAPREDELLREAVARHGRVVLPVHLVAGRQAPVPVPPMPALAQAAAALGHIHLELDEDGVARRIVLQEGAPGRQWEHFALAMLRAGGEAPPPRALAGRRPDGEAAEARWSDGGWSRGQRLRIPYAGPPGHFRRVSYLDVLEGRVGAETLAGRYVLVGATAAGMGDAYPTPMASRDALMPGVEISANVLDALRRDIRLRRLHPAENALLGVVWVALALLALHRLDPRWALGAVLALMGALYAQTWLAHARWGVQIASLWTMGCLALSHPLWSWRRLRAAMTYLDAELLRARQQADGALLDAGALPTGGDALERRMAALAQATNRLHQLQQFVRDSLDTLPDAMLVTDADGALLLANRAATRALRQDAAALRGHPAVQVLRETHVSADGSPLPGLRPPPTEPFERRVRDAQGRDLLLKCVPRGPRTGAPTGWILSLVDISTVQQAQRQREEALRFISHDLRSPQTSILALIELQRLRAGAPDAALLDRIEAHVQRTLALADGFMQLARARSDEYRFEELDLGDVVCDAVDRHWERAVALGIELRSGLPERDSLVRGDRALLTRALGHLLDNALRHGPRDGVVSCTLREAPHGWLIAVHDAGPGIPEPEQARLFEPSGRGSRPRGGEGPGLGLAFVQAVAVKHGGAVSLDSGPGRGTTFTLRLPPLGQPPPPRPVKLCQISGDGFPASLECGENGTRIARCRPPGQDKLRNPP